MRLLNGQSLAVKIFINSIIISTVLVGAMVLQSYRQVDHLTERYDTTMAEVGIYAVERRTQVIYQTLQAALGQIIANEGIVEAFARKDRAELARLTAPMKENLSEVNITIFHFHSPDNTAFFRVHKPDHFGDDLSFRKMIVYINEHRKPIKGLEQGIHGLAFRHIAPLFYQGEYIGAVEVGMLLDKKILNIFKNVNGGEWYLCTIEGSEAEQKEATTDTEFCFKSMCSAEDIERLMNKETVFLKREPNLIQIIPREDFTGEVKWAISRVYDNSAQIALNQKERKNSFLFGVALSFVGFLLVFFLTHYLLKPLSYLVNKTKSFANGDLSQEIDLQGKDEIGQLAQTMEVMRQSLIHLAYHDSLTELPNRKLLTERFAQEIARAKRNNEKVGVLFLDLDDFKSVNDTLGHNAGDKLLREVAMRLKDTLRGSDTIFRIGGDEFIVLLPQCHDLKDVEIVAEKIMEAFTAPALIDGKMVLIKASLGSSIFPFDGEDADTLIRIADEAMYQTKKGRSNLIEQAQ